MQSFEPTYNQFENRPVEAIKHLMQVQKGQAIKALYRSDIGFIDIVWGDDTMGLCHIIKKHGREFNQAGVNIWDVLPIIIKFGKVDKSRSSKKHLVVNHDFFRGVIKLNFDEKEKRFLITAFDTLFPDRRPALSGFTKNMLIHSLTGGKDTVLI
jgi:hypothetical protein